LIYSMRVSVDGFIADRDGGFRVDRPDRRAVRLPHRAGPRNSAAICSARRLYETMLVWGDGSVVCATTSPEPRSADIWCDPARCEAMLTAVMFERFACIKASSRHALAWRWPARPSLRRKRPRPYQQRPLLRWAWGIAERTEHAAIAWLRTEALAASGAGRRRTDMRRSGICSRTRCPQMGHVITDLKLGLHRSSEA